jgi:hypothetical protein
MAADGGRGGDDGGVVFLRVCGNHVGGLHRGWGGSLLVGEGRLLSIGLGAYLGRESRCADRFQSLGIKPLYTIGVAAYIRRII